MTRDYETWDTGHFKSSRVLKSPVSCRFFTTRLVGRAMKRFVRKLIRHLEPSEWGPPMFPAGWPSPPLVEISRMQAAGIDKVGTRLHPLMMNAAPQPSRHLSRDKHGHETTTATTLADRLPIRITLSWICIASFFQTFDGAKILIYCEYSYSCALLS